MKLPCQQQQTYGFEILQLVFCRIVGKERVNGYSQSNQSKEDNILPSILPEIEIVTLQGKDLLIVKVAHWKGPFYLKREGMLKGVYVRLGSTSRPAGPELLEERASYALV